MSTAINNTDANLSGKTVMAAENADTVTGLNYPYTYSDMTGFALSNAGGPIG